jgi:hypothetical protein
MSEIERFDVLVFGSGTAPASTEMAEVRARKRRMVDGLVSAHME